MLVIPRSEPPQLANDPPRILLADEQPLFLAALKSVLMRPPLCARVWTTEHLDEVYELVGRHEIQILLCGLASQAHQTAALVAHLGALPAPVHVVLMGDSDNSTLLLQSMRTGPAGLFTKDTGLDEFLDGVRAVAAGHRAIGDNILQTLLELAETSASGQAASRSTLLSPSEVEILTLVGAARSISDIARERGISVKTVRNHLANIYRKLRVTSRVEAMRWAAKEGLTVEAVQSAGAVGLRGQGSATTRSQLMAGLEQRRS